jgi:hypothetical protein
MPMSPGRAAGDSGSPSSLAEVEAYDPRVFSYANVRQRTFEPRAFIYV